MIDALAASLGLNVGNPAFWMPLLMMGLLFVLIVGAALFDGFDIGVGVLVLLAPKQSRSQLMVVLSPLRDANGFWLLLALGLFLTAFPLAWGEVLGVLYVPMSLTMLGVVPMPALARAHSGCEVMEQSFLHLDLPSQRYDGVFPTPCCSMCPVRCCRRCCDNCRPACDRAACCSAPTRAAIIRKVGRVNVMVLIMIWKPGASK